MDHGFDSGGDLAAEATSGARQAHRDAMFLQAEVRRAAGGATLTLRVRNLSAGGMMVETAEPLPRGEALRVTLRNVGSVPAVVAWAEHGRVGIAFDRPIDPREARKPAPRSPGVDLLLHRPNAAQIKRPAMKSG